MKQRILHFIIALDQLLFSVLTLGKYYPTRTVSAWAFESAKNGSMIGKAVKTMIDVLFKIFREDHCLDAYLEQNRFNGK